MLCIAASIFLSKNFAHTNRNLEIQLEQVKNLSEKTLKQELERAKLEAENERKSLELEQARDLQISMLPKEIPQVPQTQIAVSMHTATEVGGDYYDFYLEDEDTLTVVIGDATGHGLQSGTMVTATKSLFKSMAHFPNPSDILQKISNALRQMGMGKVFMCLTIIKVKDNELKMAGAGMPYPLIYEAGKRDVREIPLKGMPLGVFQNFKCQEETIALNKGDTLVVMSDGLIEQENGHKEMFGEARTRDLIKNMGDKAPAEIVSQLEKSCNNWRGEIPQQDDVTFLVLQMK
jgi:serine phosphatase RsbU (regulator of sigma subunit)